MVAAQIAPHPLDATKASALGGCTGALFPSLIIFVSAQHTTGRAPVSRLRSSGWRPRRLV